MEQFHTPAILSRMRRIVYASRIPPRPIGGLRPAFLVAKFPCWASTDADKPEVFSQQTAIASYFSDTICSAVRIPLERFQYTPCYEYHAQRWNRDGSKEEYAFSGEDVLTGMFVKWNSNEGYVNTVQSSFEAQAFSHFLTKQVATSLWSLMFRASATETVLS